MASYLERLPIEQAERFELLAHDRRRELLQLLPEVDTPVDLDDLARELVAREQGVPISEIEGERVRRCRIALYHHHLPKLADAGVVTFDADHRTVALE